MENEDQKQGAKKPIALNIINSKSKHKGFGSGSIDLNSLSPVIIDPFNHSVPYGRSWPPIAMRPASARCSP
ncbi:YwhD family protein, partial [Streptomyces sp. NPDC087512]|uniref:YwhD family protein n=1 Tax=Streptomyces sp. NPDC087512 TaxID=3155059 RepID=UPI00344664F0